MTLNEEKQLKKMIKRLVKEAIFDEMDNFQQQFPVEAKKDDDDESEDQNDRYGQDGATTTRSHAVIQKLKDPSTNNAEVMRQLWHPKDKDEEDEKRSLFSKKVRHAENDNGSEYSFTTAEMNHLYQILSNGSI